MIIPPAEMRKAVTDFRRAEINGFLHSEPEFSPEGKYLGLREAAHPTDPAWRWELGAEVSKKYRFRNGRLESIPA